MPHKHFINALLVTGHVIVQCRRVTRFASHNCVLGGLGSRNHVKSITKCSTVVSYDITKLIQVRQCYLDGWVIRFTGMQRKLSKGTAVLIARSPKNFNSFVTFKLKHCLHALWVSDSIHLNINCNFELRYKYTWYIYPIFYRIPVNYKNWVCHSFKLKFTNVQIIYCRCPWGLVAPSGWL